MNYQKEILKWVTERYGKEEAMVFVIPVAFIMVTGRCCAIHKKDK
jgi:hypothetical protein